VFCQLIVIGIESNMPLRRPYCRKGNKFVWSIVMRRPQKLWVALCVLIPLAGCQKGSTFSPEEMNKARQALETCLEEWKSGRVPEALAKRSEPIQFAEEWPSLGYKLKNYEIVGSQFTDAEMIRYTVKLTLEDRSGKIHERQPTYAIVLKAPIVIGRDPMY
jgi:hypothetical protein